jgi:lipoyl-dependent peroxiredoxin
MFEKPNVLYTAEATATGGREGHAPTSDGRVDVDLDVSAEMGGSAGPGTNPEQLFATGWAACFQSALLRFAAGRELDLSDSRVTARVGTGPVPSGGFGLVAALDLDALPLTRDVVVDLMGRAYRGLSLLKGHARQRRGHINARWYDDRAPGRLMSASSACCCRAVARRSGSSRRLAGSRG